MRAPLELPPGLNGQDTTFAAAGRWANGSNVRFHNGRAQVVGGWELLTATALTGVCRGLFPWTDNDGVLNIGFGTTEKLQLWQDDLYDITPYGPPVRLGANALTATNGSGTVVVAQSAHGYASGTSVKVFGAAGFNGLDAANLAGAFPITVINDNSWSFVAGASDTASATGAGGGAQIVVTPQTALTPGATNGTGGLGYGTGAYSTGLYSAPSTAEFYPRSWSFGAWGQNMLACPRGGGIYAWTNNPLARAVALDGAPTQVQHMLVAPLSGGYQVFALGCEEEVSGVFNPMCIRHSSVRNNTQWSTSASGSTAREYILTGGGRIVAGRMLGPYMAVWTNIDLFLGTFVGALAQPWRFERVGKNCGLIGPNAVAVDGMTAYWLGPDNTFRSYTPGGQPEPIVCPIAGDLIDRLVVSQFDKITASTISAFNEVRFDYPDDRDGTENSRYLSLCIKGPDAGAWHKGVMARTIYADAGVALHPLAVDPEGFIYYHERGNTANGGSRSWFIETADQYLDENWRLLVREIWPDFKDQIGPVTVAVYARETPQGDSTIYTSQPMAPGDAKADLLVSGRLFRIRFSGESTPTDCRIGRPVLDYARLGKI